MSRILVVEDEPNNLELALRIVRHAGHDATVATDGVTALELARRIHPELILLHLQLPKLDVRTRVRELRGKPRTTLVPLHVAMPSTTASDDVMTIGTGGTALLTLS